MTNFAICVSNQGCDDLQVGKVYRVLADDIAAKDEFVRVVDDSGEDYLYPAACLIPIELPSEAEKALTCAGQAAG